MKTAPDEMNFRAIREKYFCVVIVLVNRVIVTLFNCDTILMMGPIRARTVETNRLPGQWEGDIAGKQR